MGLPVDFNKLLELNSQACKRAFTRLFMTGTGRYAYADDWNVLADCIQNMFVTMDKMYEHWGSAAMMAPPDSPHRIRYQKEFRYIRRLHMETFECRRIFSEYKRLQWGDIVTPEHTNVLIDTAKCLDDAIERVPRRARVMLVDTDDWGTASGLIEDGTIVFVDFGTKAMSPIEVQYYLENYNVVFVILIYRHLGNTGAFYRVFYTEPYVGSPVIIRDRFRLRRGAFFDNFGVYGCHEPRWPIFPVGYLPVYSTPAVSAMFKIPTAVRWTWQYGITYEQRRIHLGGLDIPPGTCIHVSNVPGSGEGRIIAHLNGVDIPLETLRAFTIAHMDTIVKLCHGSADLEQRFRERLEIEAESRQGIGADILYSFAYARVGKGAVIEVPFTSLTAGDVEYIFDWYVGAIAHVLLGEPDKCYIGPFSNKLRKIVWMARHHGSTYFYGEEFTMLINVGSLLQRWANLSGWRLIDLRSKR